MRADPKSAKNTVKPSVIFALLKSAHVKSVHVKSVHVKSVHKTLMKSAQDLSQPL